MSYNIMRTKKIKDRSAITSTAAHNFRIRQQGNIDETRSHLNRVMWNPMQVNLKHADALQKAITGHYENLGVKERKNSVLAQEYIISASPEFFEGLSEEKVALWAEHQLKFMKNEFGDNLQIAVLHLDEKTPHLHFLLSCEEKSVKAYKNRYGVTEKETYGLNAKRWGPEFLKNLHTKHAEHNQILGLKRGKPNSGAVHKPLKEHYQELNQKEQELIKGLEKQQAQEQLLKKAKQMMAKAKELLDHQYQTIMELLDIVLKKDLTPDEERKVTEIMQEQLKETKQRVSPSAPPKGGNPP